MKVAVFLTYNYSLQTWHDSKVLDRELSVYKALFDQKKIKFDFFSYGSEYENELLKNYPEFKVFQLIPPNSKSTNKIIRLIKSFMINKNILLQLKNYDIFHQHQLLGSWIAIRYKNKLKKPLLTRTGYDMYEFAIHNKESFLRRLFLYTLTRITIRNSEIFTVASKSDKNFLQSLNLTNSKTIEIRPNWVLDNYKMPIEKRNKFEVITVGRLENQKNYLELVEKFTEESRYKLKIIGNGELKEELAKKISRNKLNVEIFDNIDNSSLLQIMNEHTFYISSSLFEGNPKTVLEAMSSGCIVIATDIKNHKELITHNENGYLFNFINSDIIEILDELIENYQLLDRLSKNASTTVLKNNHLQKLVGKMEKDYLSLIKE
jgi:glycosyltransferase involved in cell wall biosynthesis